MELKHYAELGEEYIAVCMEDEELAHGRNGLVGELPNLMKDGFKRARDKYYKNHDPKKGDGGWLVDYRTGYPFAYPHSINVPGHTTSMTHSSISSRGIGIYKCPNGCSAQIKFTPIPARNGRGDYNGYEISHTFKIIETNLKSACKYTKR